MLYQIEPRDPVLFRDGRPFNTGAGVAHTLGFPNPSTLAGCVRTTIGSDGHGRFDTGQDLSKLLAISVRGPWLWRFGAEAASPEFYFPAPRDCIWFTMGDKRERYRIVPMPTDVNCRTSLQGRGDDADGANTAPLTLLQPARELPKEKPAKHPGFWSWRELETWLRAPEDQRVFEKDFGLPPLLSENRVHVAIEPEKQTAIDGMLFQTESLRFTTKARERLALGFSCDEQRLSKRHGVVSIGGERRISMLHSLDIKLPARPSVAQEAKRLRVVLLTPALFQEGFAPKTIHGAKVVAAAVGRPEVISGWDYAARKGGCPKPTRKMAPAGSVYWVELPALTAAPDWAEGVWFQSISDEVRDQRDGFGLAVVGVE